MKFRVKIEIDNSGKETFIPQVKYNWYDWVWKNIIYWWKYGIPTEVSDSVCARYDDPKKANKAIEDLKRIIEEKESKKVKGVKYIYNG